MCCFHCRRKKKKLPWRPRPVYFSQSVSLWVLSAPIKHHLPAASLRERLKHWRLTGDEKPCDSRASSSHTHTSLHWRISLLPRCTLKQTPVQLENQTQRLGESGALDFSCLSWLISSQAVPSQTPRFESRCQGYPEEVYQSSTPYTYTLTTHKRELDCSF